MVGVSASVNLPLHHKVQKFSSGTGSPGWSWKKGRKTVVVVSNHQNSGFHKNWRCKAGIKYAASFPPFRSQVVSDWVKVSRPTRHKIGHFGDVHSSQFPGVLLKVKTCKNCPSKVHAWDDTFKPAVSAEKKANEQKQRKSDAVLSLLHNVKKGNYRHHISPLARADCRWVTLNICPNGIIFAWSIMGKHRHPQHPKYTMYRTVIRGRLSRCHIYNVYRKFHEGWTRGFWGMQADRHTDTLIVTG